MKMSIQTEEEFIEVYTEYLQLCEDYMSTLDEDMDRIVELYSAIKEYVRINGNPLAGG
jgi:hypothetical protein